MSKDTACMELPMCLRARHVFAAGKADTRELRALMAELRKRFRQERRVARRHKPKT